MDLDYINGKCFEWLRHKFPDKSIEETWSCLGGIITALVRTLELIENIKDTFADPDHDEAIIQELNMVWVLIFDSLRNGTLIQEPDLQVIRFDN